MPVYDREDEIVGFRVSTEVHCSDCYKKLGEELTGIVKSQDSAEKIFFCDECGKEIE